MAFGQQGGPPASHRQLTALRALLEQAGYATFREARGPLGFTQRQGNGTFTVAEADALIEQLEAAAELEAGPDDPDPDADTPAALAAVRDLAAPVMARELERRGWVVIPPA